MFWELGDKATFLIRKHQFTQWALERCWRKRGEREVGERREEGERGRGKGSSEEGGGWDCSSSQIPRLPSLQSRGG